MNEEEKHVKLDSIPDLRCKLQIVIISPIIMNLDLVDLIFYLEYFFRKNEFTLALLG